MQVVLGGTFDPVHDGHRALFSRAFELGDLTVGLTSDDLAPETRNEERYVRPFDERKRDLEAVLADLADEYDRAFEVRELTEPTGIADEPGFDVLVVSPETKDGGEVVNEVRAERGSTRSTWRSSTTSARRTAASSPRRASSTAR